MKIRPRQVIGQIFWLAMLASGIASVNAQSISAGERKHGFCASCHGIDGRSFKVNYPILAGQAAPYILRQLRDFKQGRRSDPTMDTIVPQLSEEDMRDLAAFFAAIEPYSSASQSDPIKAIRGKNMAERAQCVSCHLAGADSGGSELPRIQGQHRRYMMKQLKDFKAGRRANDSGVMHLIAQSMTDTDIEDLGNYFAAMHFDSRQ
jgi:cytochrome c553